MIFAAFLLCLKIRRECSWDKLKKHLPWTERNFLLEVCHASAEFAPLHTRVEWIGVRWCYSRLQTDKNKQKHKQTKKWSIDAKQPRNPISRFESNVPAMLKKDLMREFILRLMTFLILFSTTPTCLFSFLFPVFFFDSDSVTVMIFCWSMPPTSELP